MRRDIAVGGFTPLTTVDFPEHLAAVVFCQGCPWRCGYCHNPLLLSRRRKPAYHWSSVLAFLQRRKGLLDGVVFSGGEPTLQTGLLEAIRAVKALGFRVALHTAGPYPERLTKVLPWLDWVGLDIKAPFDHYDALTGVAGSGLRAFQSAKRVLASGVPHEFRTTVDDSCLHGEALRSLAYTLANLGVRHYVWQACRPPGTQAVRLGMTEDISIEVSALFEDFRVRGDISGFGA
jgi:pyruvate formate lyase activating enzyme